MKLLLLILLTCLFLWACMIIVMIVRGRAKPRKEVRWYDKNNNCVHFKGSHEEWWKEYDENNNCVCYKDATGYKEWREFKGDRMISCRNTKGEEVVINDDKQFYYSADRIL